MANAGSAGPSRRPGALFWSEMPNPRPTGEETPAQGASDDERAGTAVSAAETWHANRRVRVGTLLLGGLAGLWLIAIVAGALGYGLLSDLPFFSDDPEPTSIAIRTAPGEAPEANRPEPPRNAGGHGGKQRRQHKSPGGQAGAEAAGPVLVAATPPAPDAPTGEGGASDGGDGGGGGGTVSRGGDGGGGTPAPDGPGATSGPPPGASGAHAATDPGPDHAVPAPARPAGATHAAKARGKGH